MRGGWGQPYHGHLQRHTKLLHIQSLGHQRAVTVVEERQISPCISILFSGNGRDLRMAGSDGKVIHGRQHFPSLDLAEALHIIVRCEAFDDLLLPFDERVGRPLRSFPYCGPGCTADLSKTTFVQELLNTLSDPQLTRLFVPLVARSVVLRSPSQLANVVQLSQDVRPVRWQFALLPTGRCFLPWLYRCIVFIEMS